MSSTFVGGDAYLEQMNGVRDLQEKLAQLHFELEDEDIGQRFVLIVNNIETKHKKIHENFPLLKIPCIFILVFKLPKLEIVGLKNHARISKLSTQKIIEKLCHTKLWKIFL